jgi:hypothetical protein
VVQLKNLRGGLRESAQVSYHNGVIANMRCSGICQKAFNSGLLIATQLETGVYKSGLRNPAIELENGEMGKLENWEIGELGNWGI